VIACASHQLRGEGTAYFGSRTIFLTYFKKEKKKPASGGF
jgi:hypothetical protein